jgi:hypothetical protein
MSSHTPSGSFEVKCPSCGVMGNALSHCKHCDEFLEVTVATSESRNDQSHLFRLLHSVREKWGAMCSRYEKVGSNWHREMPGDWPVEVVMTMAELRNLASFIPSETRRGEAALKWAVSIFGEGAQDMEERAMRFAEEAVELVNAIGLSEDVVHAIVQRVYSRKKGERGKEMGQAMLTLELLAECIGVDPHRCADVEFARVQAIPKEEWERRHKAKVELGIAKDLALFQCKLDKSKCDHEWNNEGCNPAELAEWANRLSDGTVAVNLSPADAQTIIKALRSYPSAERAIRYTPVAPTEEQRRIVWESGLADIGDARLVWVNEGDFWSFDRQPQEMLAPSKPVQSHEQPMLDECGQCGRQVVHKNYTPERTNSPDSRNERSDDIVVDASPSGDNE